MDAKYLVKERLRRDDEDNIKWILGIGCGKVQTGGKNAVAQHRKVNHEMPYDVGLVFLVSKSLSPLSTFLYFTHSFCTF